MAKVSGKIRQADVQRVLRGVTGSGISVSRILVDPETGVISVFPGKSDDDEAAMAFDQWMKKQNAR